MNASTHRVERHAVKDESHDYIHNPPPLGVVVEFKPERGMGWVGTRDDIHPQMHVGGLRWRYLTKIDGARP